MAQRGLLTDSSTILSALGAKKYRQEDYRAVARFLNADRNNIRNADYRSNILILHLAEGWRFGAALTLSLEIERLPMIMRTGDSAPWMSGEALRLSSTMITKALLQRIGSVHICNLAFDQDLKDFTDELTRLYNNKDCPKPENKTGKEYFALQKKLIAERLVQRIAHRLGRASLERRISDEVDQLWRTISASGPYIAHPAEISDLVLRNHIETFYDLLFAAVSAIVNRDERHFNNSKLRQLPDQKTIKNLVIQGAGDLSMNPWNVAFYRSADGRGKLFYPQFEPILSRAYHCLIKWREYATELKKHKENIQAHNNGIFLGEDLAIARLRLLLTPLGRTR